MKIVNDLNLKKQAEELGVDVWHTPSFLFLMMGVIIVLAMAVTYFISNTYAGPEVLVISESVVVITIFAIGKSVIGGVEAIAKLNKMKSEFVAVASHQLRTPLSAIRWETELLMTKFNCGLDSKQCESINTINTLVNRMTRLVNDLLDVAKIDQGRMVLKKEKIDAVKIVEETIHDLMALADSKGIKLSFKVASKSNLILADREKLKLVMDNLISNALKYTLEKGKVAIILSKNSGFLVFTIQDNGVGIPEEQQQQIFSKFFRSDNVIKYQTEGTGLGLYIAKNIVEQLGGRIWFKSKEGAGTIFSFSMPMA